MNAQPKVRRDDDEDRRARYSHLVDQSGIPPRFLKVRFENFVVDQQAQKEALSCIGLYSELFPDVQATGMGLILSGRAGTGKTHLACALMQAVMWLHGSSCLYTTMLEASKRIKETYGANSGESEMSAINLFVKPDLLVLDEIGIGYGSDTEKLHVWEIISRRYNHAKPTILISNLDRKDLDEQLGERIMDRMAEGGGRYVVFGWQSYRRKHEPE